MPNLCTHLFKVRSPSWYQYCRETFSKILTSDLIFPPSWVNWGKGNELSIAELIAWARGHFSCLECQYLLQPALQCWQNLRRKDICTLWSVSCNPDNALGIMMHQWMRVKFCRSCHCYYYVCHSSSKKGNINKLPNRSHTHNPEKTELSVEHHSWEWLILSRTWV